MDSIEAIPIDRAEWMHITDEDLDKVAGRIFGLDSVDMFKTAYRATLLRAVELAILSHPNMISLIRTPNIYLGREHAEVAGILGELGFSSVSPEVVDYFVDIIRGRVALAPSKQTLPTGLFEATLRYQFSESEDLRCADCGYHFLLSDMSESKQEVAKALRLTIGISTPPERFRDAWKPATVEFRRATLDHIRPEAALGPATVDNLRIVCGFCNRRRQISRRHFESLSSRVSAALMAITGGERGQWAMQGAVYFSILNEGRCFSCGAVASNTELTAIPKNRDYKWTGLFPWQLETVCYSHSEL